MRERRAGGIVDDLHGDPAEGLGDREARHLYMPIYGLPIVTIICVLPIYGRIVKSLVLGRTA